MNLRFPESLVPLVLKVGKFGFLNCGRTLANSIDFYFRTHRMERLEQGESFIVSSYEETFSGTPKGYK